MSRLPVFAIVLATLSVGAQAQTTDGTATNNSPAPIVRSGRAGAPGTTSTPMPGVYVRTDAKGTIQTVSSTADGTELRLTSGRATVEVRHPAPNSMITVDLPGGQVDLVKDGLYTFNADTNTARVLDGEADAYTGSASANTKPIKIKEYHQLAFGTAGNLKATEVDPRTAASDLVPNTDARRGFAGGGYGPAYGPGYGAGYGPYGDGYAEYPIAPYPYYGYGWGYPYGYGYPFGFGLGFGYYGGFRGGYGFRGRFR